MDIRAVSPDGRWVNVISARGGVHPRTLAVPLDGGSPRVLRSEPCRTTWTPNGRRLFLWKGSMSGRRPSVTVPVAGQSFPDFPTDGRAAFEAWATLPGSEALDRDHFVPNNHPEVYVFTKADELRNLYRIPLTR